MVMTDEKRKSMKVLVSALLICISLLSGCGQTANLPVEDNAVSPAAGYTDETPVTESAETASYTETSPAEETTTTTAAATTEAKKTTTAAATTKAATTTRAVTVTTEETSSESTVRTEKYDINGESIFRSLKFKGDIYRKRDATPLLYLFGKKLTTGITEEYRTILLPIETDRYGIRAEVRDNRTIRAEFYNNCDNKIKIKRSYIENINKGEDDRYLENKLTESGYTDYGISRLPEYGERPKIYRLTVELTADGKENCVYMYFVENKGELFLCACSNESYSKALRKLSWGAGRI